MSLLDVETDNSCARRTCGVENLARLGPDVFQQPSRLPLGAT